MKHCSPFSFFDDRIIKIIIMILTYNFNIFASNWRYNFSTGSLHWPLDIPLDVGRLPENRLGIE